MTDLVIVPSNQFMKDLKRALKRGVDVTRLDDVVTKLSRREKLPREIYDHALNGIYREFRGCYVSPDWLLIYRIREKELELFLFRYGTHADLF
ncbi:MAG TPA: type II toxin-antitoxin system YafQ family toxin [Methanocorpusculum sp.]|nr:type II toxin-antitoxin system YafQ family toxin [Methanocorpusculum sp.]